MFLVKILKFVFKVVSKAYTNVSYVKLFDFVKAT